MAVFEEDIKWRDILMYKKKKNISIIAWHRYEESSKANIKWSHKMLK